MKNTPLQKVTRGLFKSIYKGAKGVQRLFTNPLARKEPDCNIPLFEANPCRWQKVTKVETPVYHVYSGSKWMKDVYNKVDLDEALSTPGTRYEQTIYMTRSLGEIFNSHPNDGGDYVSI